MHSFSWQQLVDLFKKVNFGDIDGLYDPNINDYFIDNEYKRSLLHDTKYFVIGRKGTGKSSLYNWLYRNQSDEDIMVANKSFSDFPFEKLLKLSDDSFSKPNQYQSIWKNIICSEIARLIITDETNTCDDNWDELHRYIKHVFGQSIVDLHKEVVRKVSKSATSIGYDSSSLCLERGNEVEICDGYSNLTKINERLLYVISNYLKVNPTKLYVVQFDQLDDNYTQYTNRVEYIQCLISLFKSIYQINQSFRSSAIPIKVIAYLRSDIFNQFNRHDPESSRWEQYVLKLNWAIINKNDWDHCSLLKLINARISHSLPELNNKNPFYVFFNGNKYGSRRYDAVFKYIVHRTFQRPRDLIQFCIKIQNEVISTNKLTWQTIQNAEKEYSLWLLGEIENEIAPQINDTESLYELLRLFGREPYTLNKFRNLFNSYASHFRDYTDEDMLKLLYSFGIIFNVRLDNKKIVEQFSVIRNDRSVFNRDLNIKTHPGFYEGLHTIKFLSR